MVCRINVYSHRLNLDNHIKCVELQSNVMLGLDHIVVTYDEGKVRFVQVKHTRADESLTFGNSSICR